MHYDAGTGKNIIGRSNLVVSTPTAKPPNLIPRQIFRLYGILIYCAFNFVTPAPQWNYFKNITFPIYSKVLKQLSPRTRPYSQAFPIVHWPLKKIRKALNNIKHRTSQTWWMMSHGYDVDVDEYSIVSNAATQYIQGSACGPYRVFLPVLCPPHINVIILFAITRKYVWTTWRENIVNLGAGTPTGVNSKRTV